MAESQPDWLGGRAGAAGARTSSPGWLRLRFRWLTASLWRTILALCAFVTLVSLLAGAVLHWGFGEFDSYPASIWWAFLHLLDPSALSEDDDLVSRFLGVILVISGHIFIFGLLLAILTELVGNSLRDLADVDPPYTRRNHLVVVGWNEGVPGMLAVLVNASEQEHASRDGPLRDIVILAPPELRARRSQIEAMLHEQLRHVRSAVRFGDPTILPSFDVVAAHNAWAIFVTPTQHDSFTPRRSDAAMIQIALTVERYLGQHKRDGRAVQVMVTFFWGEDIDAAVSVLPSNFDGLVWDRVWSGFMAMGLSNLPWARATEQILGPGGQSLYLIANEQLTGRPFKALAGIFAEALPIGLIEAGDTEGRMRTPAPDELLRTGNTVVVLAADLQSARKLGHGVSSSVPPRVIDLPTAPREQQFTLLVVGANHRIVALLNELAAVPFATFTIIVASRLSVDQQSLMLTSEVRERLNPTFVQTLASDRPRLRQLIDEHKPHAIVVTGDWDAYSSENVDAEAVLNYLTIKSLVGDTIPVQVTTYSSAFAGILDAEGSNQVVSRTGRIVANTLALSLLRPDLLPVINSNYDGRSRFLTTVAADWSADEQVRFDALYQGVLQRKGALYAFVSKAGELFVNPSGDTLVPFDAHLLIAIDRDAQSTPLTAPEMTEASIVVERSPAP